MSTMNKLSDLGFAAWVNKRDVGYHSFIYIEFSPSSLNVELFKKCIDEVVDSMDIFLMEISDSGLFEKRLDDTKSVSIDILKLNKESEFHHKDILRGNFLGSEDNQTFDSSFLKIRFVENENKNINVSFLANMAAINPAMLYLFIKNVSSLYSNEFSSLKNKSLSNNINDKQLNSINYNQHLVNVDIPGLAWNFINPNKGKLSNLCLNIDCNIYRKLQNTAILNKLSLSLVIKSIFCFSISLFSPDPKFRLSLPYFKIKSNIDAISDFSIQEIDINSNLSIIENAQCLLDNNYIYLNEEYSGVELLRKLSEISNKREIAPLVYTDLIDYGDLFSGEIKNCLGLPIFSVSRGAGVAIDVQQVIMNNHLYSNWDINTDLIETNAVKPIADIYVRLISYYADNPTAWQLPLYKVKEQLGLYDRPISQESNGDVKIAGNYFTIDRIQSLIQILIPQPVKVIMVYHDNKKNGLILLIRKDNNIVSLTDIRNSIENNFLGQLVFNEILIIESVIFTNYTESDYLSKYQLEWLKRISESQNEEIIIFFDVIKVISLMMSKILKKTINPKTDKNIDFFSIGGNSLLGVQLIIEINKYFLFTNVSIADLFRLRSVYELSKFLYEKNPKISLQTAQIILQLMAKNING